MLNLVTMLFGSNQVLIKTLETAGVGANDGALCMALRFGIATLALSGAMAFGKATARPQQAAPEAATSSTLEIYKGAAELALWLFLGFLAQAVGLQHTTAQSGALLGSLTVVLVPLLSLLDGRKLSRMTAASCGLALVGTTLFMGPDSFTGAGAEVGAGDALLLLSAAMFAVQMWRCEKIVRGIPQEKVSELTCIQLGIVALFSWVGVGLEGWSAGGLAGTLASWPIETWIQVMFIGLVTTAFCLWAEARALRSVDAAPAALIYACEPLWGALFAFLYRGEVLSGPCAICGAGVLLLASMVGAMGSGTEPKADQAPSTVEAPLPVTAK